VRFGEAEVLALLGELSEPRFGAKEAIQNLPKLRQCCFAPGTRFGA
jgi:hypothetical protein